MSYFGTLDHICLPWTPLKEQGIDNWGRQNFEYIWFPWENPIFHITFQTYKFWYSRHWHCTPVQFSCSVLSNSLRPHEPQHARPPCPSPTPGVHPNPCPLCRWCHPVISSSVDSSSHLQSFPASESSQMNQFSSLCGQILEFQLQHQSLQWTPRTDLL